MNNNFSNDVSGILKQKGIDPKNLKNMDKNALLKNLSAEDTKKINSILINSEGWNVIPLNVNDNLDPLVNSPVINTADNREIPINA